MHAHGNTSCRPKDCVEACKDDVGSWFDTKLAKTTEFALFIIDPGEYHQTNRDSETW